MAVGLTQERSSATGRGSLPQRPISALRAVLWPVWDFVRKFFVALTSLPFIVLPGLLPLSALLLMVPAVLPEETVLTDDNSPDPTSRGWWKRLFALASGLATLAALVFAASEVTHRLGLAGTLRWVAAVNLIYLLDLALLAAIGNVPLRYNLRNLVVRWRTTALTALAFTVVVALLTVMLAFVGGMYRITEESGQPANVLVLADGSTDEIFSYLAYSDVDKIETEQCRRDEDDQPLPEPVTLKVVNIDGQAQKLISRETYAIAIQELPGADKKKRFVQVRGVVQPELSGIVHDLPLRSGRWFSPAGVQTPPGSEPGRDDRIEAVLGAGVARELASTSAKSTLVEGDTFELGDRTWVVVGIMASDGTAFGSEVWAKQSVVAKAFNKSGYNTMVLRVRDDGPRAVVARRAELLAYHLRNRFSNPKVNAQTETEYFNKQSETNKQFLFAIIGVAIIMAVGGIFGVMNTMFAAIAQRTKDIGMLRILGYKRWQVLVSFLLESLALALAGGLIGCMLGTVVDGWSATSSIGSGQGGGKTVVLRLRVDALVWLTGLLFTLVMGRLGGLIPALSAMRLKVLESLR